MNWRRRLPKPLYLNDGRTVTTLAEALDVMLAVPAVRQSDPQWRSAADLLFEAAYRDRLDPIFDAGKQLSEALEAGGSI